MSGAVVWITGLPASGKSTLARAVLARLAARGRPGLLLDGDAVRAALVPRPGYDEVGRGTFYETLGNLALLVARQGLVAVVAATGHRRAYRDRVRRRASRFVEVWVDASPEECAARDPKGLWARARAGDAPDLPGVGPSYEPPLAPEVVARGGEDRAAAEAVLVALGDA